MTTTAIGKRIQEARREAGFRNAESLAAALGISTRTLERMEQGKEARINFERLAQIAALTRRPLTYFVSDNGHEQEPAAAPQGARDGLPTAGG